MSVTPSPIAGFAGQFFDNNGVILSGGKIFTYAAGTTTPQTTYTSATGVTPHANPIVLDSAGRVPGGEIWLTDGLIYKFVIETSTAVLIGTYDNITGVNSNFVNYTVQEEVITATAGQTVFNLTTINYTPGTNSLSVYIDGVNQYVGDSYLETDSDTVTFTAGLHVGAEVKFTTAIQTSPGATDASNVSYTPPFTGSVPTNVENKLAQYVSVKDFGAVGDGATNDTAAIQAALNASNMVFVPPGTYRCDAMIELNAGKTLELLGGATLVRLSAFSASTDPVVWIKGRDAAFKGAGQGSSFVRTQNRAPRGVVRLGHKDMTESHAGVFYCTLSGMALEGMQSFGQTTGDPDAGLYMANPQLGDVASYFHNVSNLAIRNANFGIWLNGWANGNTFSNIQGERIGNVTLGVNKNAFIYCNGALDNATVNCQFHGSPNSIGLIVDTLDNTPNGGFVHIPQANSWVGMVFEQTGVNAVGLKAIGTTFSSFYEIRANTNQGNIIPSDFIDTNILIELSDITGRQLKTKNIIQETADSSYKNLGTFQVGHNTRYLSSRKVKLNNTPNASTVSFTLSCAAEGSAWRYGFIRLTAAGGDSGLVTSPAAWYLYKVNSLNTTYPVLGGLVDSGGDTASFTVANPSNGIITVASTEDNLVVDLDWSFGTNLVLVS